MKQLLITFLIICTVKPGMSLVFFCQGREKYLDKELIHYWHFNNLPANTIEVVLADYSAVEGVLGLILYQGDSDGYMDRVEGTMLNAWDDTPAGYGLRVRNPSIDRTLVIQAPSLDFQELVLSFSVHRTPNGAREQRLQVSSDGGRTWRQVGFSYGVGTEYTLRTFDLAAIEQVDDNPGLQFRIEFLGEEAAGDSGNNRFDNIRLEGKRISSTRVNPGEKNNCKFRNYPNPFAGHTHISFFLEHPDDFIRIEVFDSAGRVIDHITQIPDYYGEVQVFYNASALHPGVYHLRLVTSTGVSAHNMMIVM